MATQAKRVAIVYGFAEGSRHATRLIKQLHADGFTIADDPRTADFIMAHSGGMYLIPADVAYRQILIVAPSLGRPSESAIITQLRKLIRDGRASIASRQIGAYLRLALWSVIYLIARSRRNFEMLNRRRRLGSALPPLQSSQVTVVGHPDDPWSSGILDSDATPAQYEVLAVDGPHDDIWYHPARYVKTLTG